MWIKLLSIKHYCLINSMFRLDSKSKCQHCFFQNNHIAILTYIFIAQVYSLFTCSINEKSCSTHRRPSVHEWVWVYWLNALTWKHKPFGKYRSPAACYVGLVYGPCRGAYRNTPKGPSATNVWSYIVTKGENFIFVCCNKTYQLFHFQH